MNAPNKNILYLSYDGITDPLGESQVIPYLKELSNKGFQFTLISFEKPSSFNANAEKVKVALAQSKIQWIPLKYHKFPPIFSTLFDLWLMWKNARRLHKKAPFSVIHCRSYISALVGLKMKKEVQVKFLFDMRGFWADERVDGGLWNLRNPLFNIIYHFFKRKEREFLEQADFTISLTHIAKQEIHSWTYIKNNPILIEVIPCCVDLSHFSKGNVTEKDKLLLKEKLGIKEKTFVLGYLGSLGTWYMLEEMLDFFKVLLKHIDDACFLIVTKDNAQSVLSLAQHKGLLEKALIITPAERDELPIYLTLFNLSIFFIRPTFSKKASSPTKQAEVMGMGIPIVCNAGIGDTTEIIQQTSAGNVITEFNEPSYRKVCKNLANLQSIEMESIRAGADSYFNLSKGVEKYHQVYEKLL